MSLRKLLASFAMVAWLLPATVNSQVIDLPAGPYGGMFRDESTRKVWLDIDALDTTLTVAERVAVLASSPFRLATRAELEPLMNVDVLSQEAVGAWSVCHSAGHDTTCKLGIYDDSATGSNPDAAGLAGLEPGHLIAFSDDSGSESAYAARTGTWAIQRGPALCASSDAYSSDMNCDGIAEKAVWRGSTGTWYIRFSGSNELLVEQWGLPGDVPIFGDYDGDRIADLAVWRPSNGTWYVKTSTSLFDSSQAVAQQFGLPGDVPVRGDYDGDGVLDYAVWRPTEGNWYVLQSASDEAVVEQWGLPGDVALVGSKAAQ